MPTVEEAADAFAKDMVAQNIAGLMMVFTPEGMMKAFGLQTQMQVRAAEAMAAGRAPAQMTGYTLDLRGVEGDDQVVHVEFQSTDGSAEIMTKWREIDGVWKVTDLGLVAAKDAEGNAVELNAPATGPAPPAATA